MFVAVVGVVVAYFVVAVVVVGVVVFVVFVAAFFDELNYVVVASDGSNLDPFAAVVV